MPEPVNLAVVSALLQLAIHLHRTAGDLGGSTIVLDDCLWVQPAEVSRVPGPFAVKASFPKGVNSKEVIDALGFPFSNPKLEQAVEIMVAAKEAMAASQTKAQRLIEEFVADMAA